MKSSLDICNFLELNIETFIKSQIIGKKTLSDKIKNSLESAFKSIYPESSFSGDDLFNVFHTALHLSMPNQPEDISSVIAFHQSIKINIFFPTAVVRVNGIGYARGIIYNNKKYPFLKNDYEQNGTIFAPGLENKDFQRIKKNLPHSVWERLFEPILVKLLESPSYSSQLCLLNQRLYSLILKESIFFIPLELVTGPLLIDDLENRRLFWRIIKDEDIRQLIYNKLFGVKGCWGTDRGTFLFYSRDGKNDLVSLYLDKNTLLGRERNLEIPFDLDEILLRSKRGDLIPSVFTSLSLLLINNITLVGGYFQVEYLAHYISALNEVFELDLPYSQNVFGCGFLLKEDLTQEKIIEMIDNENKTFNLNITLRQGLRNNLNNLKKTLKPSDSFFTVLEKL
ncbi:MAG: hypothetical protein N2654_02770 [Deltaproteobacteria bacterium]|nr:hypothetical protein [Deltaproteobacteria bacterium]